MAVATRFFTAADGCRLAYQVLNSAGTATPVVLVQGLYVLRAWLWTSKMSAGGAHPHGAVASGGVRRSVRPDRV